MPTLYQKTFPADFPSLLAPQPNGTELARDIEFGIPTNPIDPGNGIQIGLGAAPHDKCDVWFTNALTAPEQATFDAIIAAHTGIGVVASLTGTVKVLPGNVIENMNWQVLEGIITSPGFFVNYSPAELPELIARTIGEHKGDGGEFRVVESVDGQADVVMVQQAMPDTLGVWQKFKIDTTVPPRMGTRNIYRVEMRLNGAASLDQRFAAVSMVKARLVM